jgi:ATP-dependent Clp endopeptidase proteolytic subunit ClpP
MAEAMVPEFVHRATEKKLLAEADKASAEAAKERQHLVYTTAEAELMTLELEAKRRIASELRVTDSLQHVYRFTGPVDEKSVNSAIASLTTWARLDPGCDITIIFSSPGGDVVPGLALYDYLKELRRNGHYITTVVRGYAASMAGILLQAGDKRIIGAESWVLIHEISAGMMGSFGELEDRLRWLEKVQGRVLDIFTERSGGKKTREEFEKAWSRADFWLDSEMALSWGVADEIG